MLGDLRILFVGVLRSCARVPLGCVFVGAGVLSMWPIGSWHGFWKSLGNAEGTNIARWLRSISNRARHHPLGFTKAYRSKRSCQIHAKRIAKIWLGGGDHKRHQHG